MLTFPRETVEFLPITVTVLDENGVPVEDPDYEISVVPYRGRPEDWEAPPYLITGLEPGYYEAYVRVADSPETPVEQTDPFAIT